MTAWLVVHTIRRRARRAGVPPCTPHDLRRSFVSDLRESGADTIVVQRLAGHARPETTARYDRRPEEAKAKAASRLKVPYRAERPQRPQEAP